MIIHPHKTITKTGAIHAKAQKTIAPARFQDHYMAIPLFTHNGNGLAYTIKPDELVSIIDRRAAVKSRRQSQPDSLTLVLLSRLHLIRSVAIPCLMLGRPLLPLSALLAVSSRNRFRSWDQCYSIGGSKRSLDK